jgi:hypothetical protein
MLKGHKKTANAVCSEGIMAGASAFAKGSLMLCYILIIQNTF